MAVVQDWVDSIRMDVPEPLDTLVARQVRYAIQEFFRISETWVHRERIVLESDEVELAKLPVQTYIASTKFAYFEPERRNERIKLTPELAHRLAASNTVSSFSFEDNVILLDGFESGILEVAVVVQPTRNIDEVPDSLCDKWFDVIRRGAIARLLSMPDRMWTDTGIAGNYEAHFREGIERARREARNDRSRPKRSVRFNRGFAW